MARCIALIRGINVGAHRKVPMAELRDACAAAGLPVAATYIQSGNLVLDTGVAGVEARLEAIVAARFGIVTDVIARSPAAWAGYVADCPFPDVAATDPNLVLAGFCKRPADTAGIEALAAREWPGVRLVPWQDGLVTCYDSRDAMRASRLSPAMFDKAAGSPVTTRNWRTVTTLYGML